jgi:hypothetical protein
MSLAVSDSSGKLDAILRWLGGLVRGARRRLRWSWVGAGAGLLVGFSLLTILAAAGLDLVFVLPDFARWIAFLAAVGVASSVLVRRVLRPLFARLPLFGVALRIERQLPGMHNRLVTALDMANADRPPESEPFFGVVVRQAADRLEGYRPGAIVDRESLRKSALWAGAPLALGLGAWLAAPEFTGTAVARVLQPWADIPPASFLKIAVEPGDAGVLLGDPASIVARIDGGAVDEIRVKFTTAAGEVRTVPVRAAEGAGGTFTYAIDKFEEPLRYRVYAGRTWSKEHQLRVVERPLLEKVALTLAPPAYLGKLPAKEISADERTLLALPGSDLGVQATTRGEVSSAWLARRDEEFLSRWTADYRNVRWWMEDEPPAGSWAYGSWNWDWSHKFRRTHFEPANVGESRHGVGFQQPLPVRSDDVLFTHVFLDPRNAPAQICIEFSDGGNWDHRVWWGVEKMKKAPAEGAAWRRLGNIPSAGQWTRLEIPARAVGLDGRQVREIAFCVFGGAARWDWFGAAAGRDDPERKLGDERKTELASAGPAAWQGGTSVDRQEVFTVRLQSADGHGNRAPDEYRIKLLEDRPPTVRIDSPSKDITLATPSSVEVVGVALDDFGLASAELRVKRQRDGKTFVRDARTFSAGSTLENVRASVPLAEFQAQPGDVFTYKLAVKDRKGQSAESPEYRVALLVNDPDAFDKRRERALAERRKLSEKLQELAKAQEEIAKKTEELAARHPEAPQKEEPRSAPAERQPDSKQPDSKKPDGQSPNAKPSPEAKKPDAKTSPEKKNADRQGKPKRPNPNEEPLGREERKEVGALQNSEARVQQQAAMLAKELDDLAEKPDAQALDSMERAQIAKLGEDIRKDASPEVRQANKELQDAQRAAEKPSNELGEAKQATAQAAKELKRLAERAERMERAEQLADDAKNDPAAAAEREKLLAEMQAEMNADRAAEKIESLAEAIDRLKQDVTKEQQEEDRTMAATDAAKNRQQLDQAERMQDRVEGKAKETLRDVSEVLSGKSPRDLSKERPADADMPEGEGAPKEDQPGDKPDDGAAAPQPKDGAADMPGEKGAAKEDAGKAGEPADKSGQSGDQKAGEGGEPTQFESLKSGAGKRRSDPRAKQGRPDDQVRNELKGRQDMLSKDLSKASQALDAAGRKAYDTVEEIRQAGTDAKQINDKLGEAGVKQQLAAAERARQLGQKGKSDRSMANGKGMNDLRQGPTMPALIGDSVEGNRIDDALAGLKLLPRDREELIQGTKSQAPDSYKPFVRDYYNRLSEINEKK